MFILKIHIFYMTHINGCLLDMRYHANSGGREYENVSVLVSVYLFVCIKLYKAYLRAFVTTNNKILVKCELEKILPSDLHNFFMKLYLYIMMSIGLPDFQELNTWLLRPCF